MDCEVIKTISRLPQRLLEKTIRRKRIMTKGELEEKRRSISQEMMTVRNKVRRYKFLDEVATR